MNKLALNFICKNESHVVVTMLQTAAPIIDLIVAVDTGSTDHTVSVIETFAARNSIPVYIFSRPFDNFCNSRNYALEKLHWAVYQLKWQPSSVWGMVVDCDERIIVSDQFNKGSLVKDIYVTTVKSEQVSSSRQLLFRLSGRPEWQGPIHEILTWKSSNLSIGSINTITILHDGQGASWQGNVSEKYISYARKLEQYVNEGHENFRWVYYIGESYLTAAAHAGSKSESQQLLQSSKEYFERSMGLDDKTTHENLMCHCRIAQVKKELGLAWPDVQQSYLKAYCLNPDIADAISSIVDHYMASEEWNTAHLFSSFAVSSFHGRNPYSVDCFIVDESLYQWRLLLNHVIICANSGRNKESMESYRRLKAIVRLNSGLFGEKDRLYIRSNSPRMLVFKKLMERVKNVSRKPTTKQRV